MSESLALSNDELFRATLNAAGLGRDVEGMDEATEADLRAILRSGLRRALLPMVGEFPYRWRWLQRYHSNTAEAFYQTGTITAVDGTITLAGGTWPTWAADAFISIDGNIVFIDERTSGTVLVAANTALDATAGTTFILYRYRYPLPTDFAEWADGLTYSKGTDNWKLSGADEAELRLRYAVNYNYNNRTTHYAVIALPDGTFNIMYWPIPEEGAFVRGVYYSMPEDNLPTDLRVVAVDPVIQCAPIYAECFVEAVLAAAEVYNNDMIGVHEQRYQQALAYAVAHDKSAVTGFDFSRHLGRRIPRQSLPTSIDFSGQL